MSETITFNAHFEVPKATHQGSLGIMLRGRGFKIGGRTLYPLSAVGFGARPSSPAGRAKKLIKSELLEYVPNAPLQGPLHLTLVITWPYQAGHKKSVKSQDRVPHFAKPDADNVAKIILDTMTDLGYWYDDGQLSELSIVKAFGARPALTVSLYELPLPGALQCDDVHKGITKRWV